MKKYKIICYYPSDIWAVLEQVEKDDHTTDWSEAYRCKKKGKDGYIEAINWLIKKNDENKV